MSRGAVAEMQASEAARDRSPPCSSRATSPTTARPRSSRPFEACYRPAFGDRLHVVRGNHDGYRDQSDYEGDEWIDLPGVVIALIDTVDADRVGGTLTADQIDWLDAARRASTDPVVVMGHHPDVVGRRPAAHDDLDREPTQRALDDAGRPSPGDRRLHRRAHPSPAGAHDGGRRAGDRDRVRQGLPRHVGRVPGVRRRRAAGRPSHLVPDALAWSERCRGLYADFGRRLHRATPSARLDRPLLRRSPCAT